MAADYRSIGPIAFFQFNSRSATEIVEPHVFEHQLVRNAYPCCVGRFSGVCFFHAGEAVNRR